MIFTFRFLLFISLMFSRLNSEILAQNFDYKLLKSINLDRNKSLDPTMKFLSNSTGIATVLPAVTVTTIGLIQKDSSITNKGLFIAASYVVSSVLVVSMKYAFKRPRPFVTHPELDKQSPGGSPSFPSGHTAISFNMATSLTLAFPKWYVAVPTYLYAAGVGYSRMHLGVHYPSDVLVGAIIGSGTAVLTHYLNKRWFGPKKVKRKI